MPSANIHVDTLKFCSPALRTVKWERWKSVSSAMLWISASLRRSGHIQATSRCLPVGPKLDPVPEPGLFTPVLSKLRRRERPSKLWGLGFSITHVLRGGSRAGARAAYGCLESDSSRGHVAPYASSYLERALRSTSSHWQTAEILP